MMSAGDIYRIFVMTAAQIKILVSVFLLLAIWRIFEIPGVAQAFWEFCTVGAIPGSDRELGTEVVIRIALILFAVIFFIVFRREFFAALPRRRAQAKIVEATTVPADNPLEAPHARTFALPERQSIQNRLVIVLSKHQHRSMRHLLRPLALAAAMLLGSCMWLVQSAGYWLHRGLAGIYHVMQPVGRWLADRALVGEKYAYRFGVIITRIIIRGSVEFWRWLEPHLRSFDRWLDMQLHANKRTAGALKLMNEAGRATTASYQKAQDITRKLIADK
jgi:hypothetical protein